MYKYLTILLGLNACVASELTDLTDQDADAAVRVQDAAQNNDGLNEDAATPGSDASDMIADAADSGEIIDATSDGGADPVDDGGANPDGGDPSGDGGQPPNPNLSCANQSNYILCEDFESGALPNGWTRTVKNGGIISVVNDRAREGSYALRVRTPVNTQGSGYIYNEAAFPVAGNHFFGRVYFQPTPDYEPIHVHDAAFFASGSLNYNGVTGTANYKIDFGKGKIHTRYAHPYITGEQHLNIHGGLKTPSGYKPPADQWTCIEWEFDGAQDRVNLWINGVLQPNQSIVGGTTVDGVFREWRAPTFTRFSLGYHSIQVSTAQSDAYYDAFVLSTQRVGCGS